LKEIEREKKVEGFFLGKEYSARERESKRGEFSRSVRKRRKQQERERDIERTK
jgi:hypothetical protein